MYPELSERRKLVIVFQMWCTFRLHLSNQNMLKESSCSIYSLIWGNHGKHGIIRMQNSFFYNSILSTFFEKCSCLVCFLLKITVKHQVFVFWVSIKLFFKCLAIAFISVVLTIKIYSKYNQKLLLWLQQRKKFYFNNKSLLVVFSFS